VMQDSGFCELVMLGCLGFLLFLDFVGVFLLFLCFFLGCPFCIFHVCLGLPLRFL
jgi:hypothetical protein